eukprot:NODE_11006_length_1314_cov_4.919966.p1 GENE.NODE_11006_length_1314_cov_4.919966~~NODE_11006_length_1314_cov_4.919966.p1  ORF type:complete len:340 (-),score=113.92 NODE_11006_length_1314_cov_4.919966:293-1264(-)
MLVAVKEIKDTSPTDATVVDFILEIALLSQLNHPNIMRFWRGSIDSHNGTRSLLMVTEYLKLGGLSRLLHGHGGTPMPNPLELPQALSLALGVARGVQYLYTQRVLHLDLKSPNVLIGLPWTAKLCDFGVAKIRGDHTLVHSTLPGVSPVWAAPEMYDDKCAGLTEKADVYSFAIIFFEVLTKKLPFQEVPPKQLPALKEAGALPQIPPDVPEDCAQLIRDCCGLAPGSRPKMSGGIARLVEIAEDRNIVLSEVTPPEFITSMLAEPQPSKKGIEANEPDAASQLITLDAKQMELNMEVAELQRSIKEVRSKMAELSVSLTGG